MDDAPLTVTTEELLDQLGIMLSERDREIAQLRAALRKVMERRLTEE